MKFAKKILSFFTLACVSTGLSAPWNNGIEIGTSIAHSYGSRNLFINPAAIAFEKELNGSGLLSSFTYGSTFSHQNEFSFSTTYNVFGFGYEKLSQDADAYSRYQLGMGYSLSPELFWGTRLSTTSSDKTSLSGNISLDLGLQYRPSSFVSFGLMASELNQSTINGVKSPINYTLGIVVRPADWINLTTDIETHSTDFGKDVSYQTNLAIEPVKGFSLITGFQKDHRFQIGIQFDLNKATLFSVVHPSPQGTVKNNSTNYTIGFQTSLKSQASHLNQARELRIDLDDDLTEGGREGSFWVKGKPSLLELLESIQSAGNNPAIDKIIVHLESFPLGLAAAEELSEALLKARTQGKTIEAFLTSAKTKEYLIASAASTIYLEPSGDITLLGPRVGHYFAKGTLDKIGMEGEFIARGDYKSAPETFTRKESSIKSKEATQHELREIEKALLNIFRRTRSITEAQWQAWIKYAVFGAQDALKEKLIDKIGSFSDLKNGDKQTSFVDPISSYSQKTLNLPSRIAVITADGTIMEKRNRWLGMTSQSQVTPKDLEPLFRKAIIDPRTKAIVLRVSSPGGEVLASEQIANLVKEAKSKKPVIISMGDVAASGGYFISAPAQTIFADKLTLTGSIGVFLGKFNLSKLYQKLDLKKEILGFGPYASIDSEHKPWTAEERAIMKRRLDQFYESFVEFVAKNRNISKEEAEKAAQGRVWMGQESVGLKIVDKQGGILEAIQTAKSQTGLKTEFITYPVREPVGVFEALSEEAVPTISTKIESLGLLFDPKLQIEIGKLLWIQKQSLMYLADQVQVF